MTRNLAALIAIFAIAGTQIASAKAPGLTGSDWSQIRAEYQRHQHSIAPGPDGWQAPNRSQQWMTRFDGRGFSVEPNHGGWHWGLDLRKYGFEGAERGIQGKARVSVAKDRATYDWGAGFEEWYHNSPAGLEHGYTLHRRPEGGDGPLRLTLAVRGGLRPKVAGGTDVAFLNAQGGVALNYAGLKVTDATGRRLSAWFTADEQGLRLDVDERGARYPVTIDPTAQQAYLKPAAVGTTQAGDEFGYAVAISGDTLVVGAYLENSSTTGVNSTPNESASDAGAVYVFTRSSGVWTQQAYLKPAAVGTTQAGDWFGHSVAISGDTLVVGAPGENSSTTGVNSTPNESATGAGAAYVFTRTSGVWSQQAYLKPAAVGTTQMFDEFGYSVAISGDTVVVGAIDEDSSTTGVNSTPNESASGAGAVYVFSRNSGVWTQQAYLKPAAVGTTQAFDEFGYSVAISGDTVVVGAVTEDSSTTGVNSTPNESASQAGAAYVYIRAAGVWSQQAYLKPAAVGTTQTFDNFGWSVAISGDTLVVGAEGEDSSTTGVNSTPNESASLAGAAYVFTRTAGAWSQQAYLKPAAAGTSQAGDLFGGSVAISGNTLVVGARNEASSTTGVNSAPNESALIAGAAYVFTRTSGVWSQQEYLKPAVVGTTQLGDGFGVSVAISADTVVVGARQEDSSTTGVNSTPNESAQDSGAAYVFTTTGVAVNLTASGGSPQSAPVNTAFATSLQARVTDGSGNPVSGVTVNFGAPGSGASAVLSAASAVTNGSGVASVNATANATAGSYLVTASASGASATFSLTNLAQGGLTPPTITAPATGSTVTTTVVTFSWTAVAGATKYELKLIEANTPQQFRVELLGNNATSAVYTFPSGSYRMEVKACDATACGAAAVSTFVLQGGAVPSATVTGVGCQVVNASSQNQLNCNWNALSGAHFYLINVVQPGAGPGGGALTVAGRQVGGTSVSILIPNGQAVVLVRGCTGDGCGPFSTGVNINASIGNPLTPMLGEPFAGSSVDSGSNAPNVTFSWNRVAGDTGSNFRYRLYVQDFALNQPALDVITPDNFYGAYFNPGTRYDALVIAIPTGGGAQRQGPPSAFVIRGRVPKSPVMTQPSYSSTVTRDGQGQVTVAWTPLVNNDGTVSVRNYQYFFNGPSQFSGITTATTISLPLTPGNWLGIVRACTTGTTCTANSAAGWGPWNNEAGSEGGQAAFTVAP